MATKVLSNDFMQDISMKDAWKELSSDFGWSEAMLEKYQDKVDWDDISENRHIRWTIPMIRNIRIISPSTKSSHHACGGVL